MGFGEPAKCSACDSEESAMWYQNDKQEVVCRNCHNIPKDEESTQENTGTTEESSKTKEQDKEENVSSETLEMKQERLENELDKEQEVTKASEKSIRTRKSRKAKQGSKAHAFRGRSRRHIFKKHVYKSPASVATTYTSNSVFFEGIYYRLGDIVSVTDAGGGTYYAQITGLLTDQYCEKSATLAWLLPTVNAPPPEEKFDPSAYVIGPEESFPRKLEYMEFVCRAPSNYYKDQYSPYPVQVLDTSRKSVTITMQPVPRGGKS